MKRLATTSLILIGFLTCVTTQVHAQQNANYNVNFQSGQQSMWGPSTSTFSINKTTTLFEQGWNETFNLGSITTLAGQKFGAKLTGGFSGLIGSKFSLKNFTSGTVEVDYPINIFNSMPTNLTYDQGDAVTINTNYSVAPGYSLDTDYPALGEIKLDVYFQMAGSLSGKICAFGCSSFDIIPSFNTGLQTINVLTVNQNGAWYLGEVDNFAGNLPGINGFPYSKPPDPGSGFYWQAHVPFFPVNVSGPGGLSGVIDIPHVNTTDSQSGLNLTACGNDQYLNVNLEIFKLLGAFMPPPYKQMLENLSGSESIGVAEVDWNFLSASLDANVTNNQCFYFTPTVKGKYVFSTPVEYQVLDGGSTVASGYSSIVNMKIGNQLRYNFPCYYDSLSITPTYSIIGQFRNHTWDVIQFDFLMSAVEFGLLIPEITVTPEIIIPAACVNIPYPCGTFSDPFKICKKKICTPEIVIPAIIFDEYNPTIGPLFNASIPVGNISYDWLDQTWNLEGFSAYAMTPFSMKASPLSIAVTHTNVDCFGDATGTVDITPSAVSPANPIIYTWTNGSSTQDLSNLPAGSYQVSAIDNNGCQMITGAIVDEPVLPLTLSESHVDKSCNGGIDDGTIDLNVIGGSAPYTYSWSNSATTQDLANLNAGGYIVTVTDSKLCTETMTVQIGVPMPLSHVASITDVNCNNGNDGEISTFVSGGILPYGFLWSNGATADQIQTLTAGTYTFTVTDANGCVYADDYTVDEPLQPLALSSTTIDVDCNSSSTGSVDVTTTGGTSGYAYTWTNGLGQVLPFTTEDISNIPADNYTVLVTDANGCTETISDLVDEPDALTDNPVLTHILCYGASTGAVDPGVQGGTTAYTYSWSNGTTNPTLTNVPAGAYSLGITDSKGCSETFNYTLNQPTDTLSVILSPTHVLCYGDATGAVGSTVSGGTGPYQYAWTTGATSTAISNLVTGNYPLTVTDAHGCLFNNDVDVLQPLAPLQLSTLMSPVDCYGNSSGGVDLTVTGGTASYDYYWWNQNSLVLVQQIEDLIDEPAGTYYAVVHDANGCFDTIFTTITQPTQMVVSGIVDDANCFGLNDGAIDVTTTGGIQPYTFNWQSGQSTEDLNAILAGTYNYTATDDNGCVVSDSWVVQQPNLPLEATLESTDILCFGNSTGVLESTVTGGTTPYVYNWSNSATTEDLNAIVAGNYSLTVTDDQGCTAFTGAVINQPAELEVVTTIVDPSCFAYSDGTIELAISGGIQPYFFNWGNQNEIMVNNPSELLENVSEGVYFLRVRDDNGCIYEEFVTVNQPDTILVAGIISNAECFSEASGSIDQSVTGGTLPYTFSWITGETTEDLNAIPIGEYEMTVEDGQGCRYSAYYFVSEPNEINIASNVVEVSCIDQADAEIYITPYGGTAPYSFDWQIAQDQNVQGLAPGSYNVIITDANGCSREFEFNVIGNDNECLIIPNAFTPNGDNYNDTWVLGNMHLYPKAVVHIFNKWGNKLYSTSGEYIPWDGTDNGKVLPSSTFYYIIELNNEQGNKYQGTVTTIR